MPTRSLPPQTDPMQHAQHFFEGLTGPASLTFLGLLFAAFLIGVLPAGLAYATRVRKLKRRLARERAALAEQRTRTRAVETQLGERTGALEEERVASASLRDRIGHKDAQLQRHHRELEQAREEAETLRGTQLATQIEAQENAALVQSLRGRIDALTAQVQGLKQAHKARPAPAGAFDANTVASLRAARSRAEGLEERLNEVMADNERLRGRLLAG